MPKKTSVVFVTPSGGWQVKKLGDAAKQEQLIAKRKRCRCTYVTMHKAENVSLSFCHIKRGTKLSGEI